ncbi:MAG: asparaginase [Neisseria sp.]|nr:asparaginase [Neisseria sp.]
MAKHIFVLYTGGTIGMRQDEVGLLHPHAALAGEALPHTDGLKFDWHICSPLIDSSALTPGHWRDWLAILAEKIPRYDGILILHGTDTLAYTANILALALHGLDKPVILTGSQLPFGAPNSDAPHNLATAATAFPLNIPEVQIAFDGCLFPAVGSSKVSTETAAGFANPHFGILNQWSAQQGWRHKARPQQQAAGAFGTAHLDPCAKVACHTLIPGHSVRLLAESLRRHDADAVVLCSYGHGNTPDDADFIAAANAYTANGGLLLNISQVQKGRAAAVYAQGGALRRAGAVSGGKCNLETAAALLTLAVSAGWDAERLRMALHDLHLTD